MHEVPALTPVLVRRERSRAPREHHEHARLALHVPDRQVHLPYARMGWRQMAILARVRGEPAGVAAAVKQATDSVSIERLYDYQKTLFDFGSKHITRPGNAPAIEYLYDTFKSFGYEPEYQWLTLKEARGGQTANVIATLRGTINPELVYVVSSHYDSIAEGPGADDNAAGTAALLRLVGGGFV